MSYPTINEDLLACVLKFLEEHPKNYFQNTWLDIGQDQEDEFCGTLRCVAGWTCVLTCPENEDWKTWKGWRRYENGGDIVTYAQKKLGLEYAEATFLFKGSEHRGPEGQLKEIKRRVAVIRQARLEGKSPYELSTPE